MVNVIVWIDNRIDNQQIKCKRACRLKKDIGFKPFSNANYFIIYMCCYPDKSNAPKGLPVCSTHINQEIAALVATLNEF